MIQSNEHTTPEQRFFFPSGRPIEYYDSFDPTGLPSIQTISGKEAYAVTSDDEDKIEAHRVSDEGYILTPGSIVLSIRSLSDSVMERPYRPDHVSQNEFDIFNPDKKFTPTDGMLMMVQAQTFSYKPIPHPAYTAEKIAYLPATQALPSFKPEGIKDDDVKFRLLGFITVGDALASWSQPHSHNANLIEWAVIGSELQNRLEEALLRHSIGGDLSMVGLLDIQPVAKGYLEYFDAKHGTNFTPKHDFRGNSQFPDMSNEHRELYFQRIREASSF